MSDFNTPTVAQIVAALHAHSERQELVIRNLQAALRPFAALADGIDPVWADERRLFTLDVKADELRIGDARRAKAAMLGIAPAKQPQGSEQ